jgi:hypothetical protein
MTRNLLFQSVLTAVSVLLVSACATQPKKESMLDTRFQRAASQYDVNFLHEGQRVYCKRSHPQSLGLRDCVTEAHLRAHVEDERKLFMYFPPGSGATL